VKGFPSPPVLAGTLSGFVVGVFVTLIATGVISHTSASSPPAPTPTVAPGIPDPVFYQRAKNIAVRQLGPSASSPKEPRFVSLKLLPAVPIHSGIVPAEGLLQYRSIELVFRLYDHPLGRVWRLRAAKADVFAVMKALYTSPLPVYDVRMIGRFPLGAAGHKVEQTALQAYLEYGKANRIPWRLWTRKQEAQLWNTLTSKHVDPRFA
jgi:hypothetical protein